MAYHLSREEREEHSAQLAQTDLRIAELSETLASFDGPIIYGQSKEQVKGLLEQQLANLERQRDGLTKKLGFD